MQRLVPRFSRSLRAFVILLVGFSFSGGARAQETNSASPKTDLPSAASAVTTANPPQSNEQQTEEAQDAMASWSYSTYRGKVLEVVDGNTVIVSAENKKLRVRLLGVGAPEKGQPLADKSREQLARLLNGKTVEVLVIPGQPDRGGKSPILGKVLLEGADVGVEQIRSGFGWLSNESENYQTHKDRRIYADAEQTAAAAKLGLWSDDFKCKQDLLTTTTNPPTNKPGEIRARMTGTVRVQILIDESGKVISAKAICGHPLLQQAAVKAAYGARFRPTLLSGTPVKVNGVITYNFVPE